MQALLGGYQDFGLFDPTGALDVFSGSNSTLSALDADGGVSLTAGVVPVDAAGAAFDGTAVYFIAETGLYRLEGTTLTSVSSLYGIYASDIAVDADNVYVSGDTYLGDGLTLEALVLSVPKIGDSPISTLFARVGAYTQFAFDDPFIYMTDRFGGDVLRMGKDGTGESVVVDDPAMQVLDLAVDDSCVYWTGANATTRGVYVAPK